MLRQIHISNFRNFRAINLDLPKAGYCVVLGPNGSGKTSLLEAIYVLSCGKSFRASELSSLIQHEANGFALFATSWTDGEKIGVQRDREGRVVVKFSGQPLSFAEIARKFPIRIMSPIESYALINGGPEQRRRFLDWGMFHVKHFYWTELQKLHRIIKQKNAALKMRCSDEELIQWNQMLAESSYSLDAIRKEHIIQLNEIFKKYCEKLPILASIQMNYLPGWARESTDLFTQLSTAMRQERHQGFCLLGPHRADIMLEMPYGLCKNQLSRGRQKILAIVLYLAQGELLFKETGRHPLYMIDDFASELDSESQQFLIDALDPSNKQIIITALEKPVFMLNEKIKSHHVQEYAIQDGYLKNNLYA